MVFDPEIWGPHYWFFLHTIAQTYPKNPNAVAKRKYYDFIMNLPLFIPDPEIGNRFASMLDKYPVTPYLDSRDSFIKWVHFIHNKINYMLGKEEISLLESLEKYKAAYRSKPIYLSYKMNIKIQYVHIALIFACLLLIYVYS
jgi:hypothetical protein